MDPPRERKRRERPVEADIAEKIERNMTVELETADFDEVGQSGVISGRQATLSLTRTTPVADPSRRLMPDEASIVIDGLEIPPDPPPHAPQPDNVVVTVGGRAAPPDERDIRTAYVERITAPRPIATASRASGRRIAIVALYTLALGALAISLYYRFG